MNKKLVEVPGLVRDCLQPYTEIFEGIVIPMIKRVPLGLIDDSLSRRLHREITGYENRKERFNHPFLTYYGLMLCCMYASQECFEFKKSKPNTEKLGLINRRLTNLYHL